MEKEVKKGRENENEARVAYDNQLSEAQTNMDTLEQKLVELGNQVADTMSESVKTTGVKNNKMDEKTATETYVKDLKPNCDWVDLKFDSRRAARKAEIKGLQNAKATLAGAGYEPEGTLVQKGARVDVDAELAALDQDDKKLSFLNTRK